MAGMALRMRDLADASWAFWRCPRKVGMAMADDDDHHQELNEREAVLTPRRF
jgi:hypothetical protein